MENKTPRFRLENISHIPEGISKMIKEIIAEISPQSQLKPELAGVNNLNYSCDPYCSCNTQCDCDPECNYCRCVEHCKCVDHDPCPNYIPCGCEDNPSCPNYRFNV